MKLSCVRWHFLSNTSRQRERLREQFALMKSKGNIDGDSAEFQLFYVLGKFGNETN